MPKGSRKEEAGAMEGSVARTRVKRYSIFWLLTVLLVAMVVIPLVSFAVKAINVSRSYLEDTLRERQLKTARAAASHIQSVVRAPADKLKTLTATFEVYSSEPDVSEKYSDLIERRVLDQFLSEEILVTGFVDIQGNRVVSNYPTISQAEVQKVSNILWQIAAESMSLNGVANSRVYLMSLKGPGGGTIPVEFFATPLRKNGEPIAALVVMANLRSINEALDAYGKEFQLAVTDLEGNLVIRSQEGGVEGAADFAKSPYVTWFTSKSPEYKATTTNSSIQVEEGGKQVVYLVTCSPMEEEGLLLFSYVDKDQFFTPITRLQATSTLWVALSILAALFFGVFIARQITRPISILTEESRKLAGGDFTAKADVKTRNEVGELAEAFNFMASEIQKYVQEVEAKAEENKHLFMNSISSIVNAIDAKDPYTRGHSARVSAYSVAVAKEYGFDEKGLRIVKIASLLHDVGKIGIEDRILRKPGALTDDEFSVMKTHPAKGAEILGSIPQMKEMIPGIKHHHEKWSGGGYPEGLKGSDIPILARIIGVADAFDAMTTDRPYQKAMTFLMAVNRINELTPKVYDPLITEAFNKAYGSGVFDKIAKLVEERVEKKAV